MSHDKPDFKPLSVSYDPSSDILTIDEFKYSGGVFRGLGVKTRPGYWMRALEASDGVIVVQQKSEAEILKDMAQ